MKTKVMVSKIGQINIKPSSWKDPCGICGKKQWQMQYYANHEETGYIKDVKRLKG